MGSGSVIYTINFLFYIVPFLIYGLFRLSLFLLKLKIL